MLYLVYGDQSAMIKNRLKKIAKERLEFVDEVNFVKYDAREHSLLDIIDEANQIPLGYDRKMIILENCEFLSTQKGKSKNESSRRFK